ncbi:MAG: TonB-dependent receptor plug domain-containing protein [Aestuariibacter sp.]
MPERWLTDKLLSLTKWLLLSVFWLILFTPVSYSRNAYIDFDIPAMPADQALTKFAKQANTTLLFPYELAAKEMANPLQGRYLIEIAIVKLLEGTQLFPYQDENGQFSVRAIQVIPPKYIDASETPTQQAIVTKSQHRSQTYQEALQETYIEKIAIVGTRNTPRNAVDSSVPLDVVNSVDLVRQGNTDLISMLSKMIPSLNVNDQPINDASTLVRPANLRGMSSDHTLVLVNGKRRHRSAVITFLGGGLSDGAQGPDIAAIPYASIHQVGVLRDGASAQYGSDAIAGVLNFSLKDFEQGGSFETRVGQYYAGDGLSAHFVGNTGFTLPYNGFVNISSEYREQNATSRSVQRSDAAQLQAAGVPGVSDPSQTWGTPEVHYDAKLAFNLGLDVTVDSQLYSFATFSKRRVEGGFFYRNPQTRRGVNVTDTFASDVNQEEVFDESNEVTHYRWLVADLTPDDANDCPVVIFAIDDLLYQQPGYQTVMSDANCFAFNKRFPGGFTPRFSGRIEDAFGVIGLKGDLGLNWQYDLSGIVGYSKISYGLENTVNPSLGPDSPTVFRPGSAVQIERSVTLDLKRQFDIGTRHPVNFATGLEWRRENYRQIAGDEASYTIGPYASLANMPDAQGFSVGSNGFPGYRPETAGDWSRGNFAAYIDLETDISTQLTLSGAIRFEDYTDFGRTFDGKIALMYELNQYLAFRTSMNTGFKAPTVGQSNVINVTTAFGDNGLEDQATLPPTDPISQQLGATPLQPEESINTSFGLVGKLGDGLYLTLDYFNIRLNDRISTTSAIPLRPSDIRALRLLGVQEPDRYGAAKYFTNDFDTTTQGMDVVFNYVTENFGGQTQFSVNYNWTRTEIDRISLYERRDEAGNTFLESNLSPQRIRMIEENIPEHRASMSLSQTHKNLNALLRINYYGGYYEDHLDASADLDIVAGSELTLDVELGYQYTPQWQFIVGANNLFDNPPDDNPHALTAGALYPSTSPMGINGGLLYFRSVYNF